MEKLHLTFKYLLKYAYLQEITNGFKNIFTTASFLIIRLHPN